MLIKKSQVLDYRYRPQEMEGMSVWDYFTHTYETKRTTADNAGATHNLRGRPRKTRFEYTEDHPRSKVAMRIEREPDHNTLINMIGTAFPNRDDPAWKEEHPAQMLMLLKPWRNLETNLKSSTEVGKKH